MQRRSQAGIVIFDLQGELSLYSAARTKEILFELADKGDARVLLNGSSLEYVDSSGLGLMIASLTRFKKNYGQMKLCNFNEQVRTVFRLTKTERLFEIYETEEEALASFE